MTPSTAAERDRLRAGDSRSVPRECAPPYATGRPSRTRRERPRHRRHGLDYCRHSAAHHALLTPPTRDQGPASLRRPPFQTDPAWHALMPPHEYFHTDTGPGIRAVHPTGQTGLVVDLLPHRKQQP